MAIYNESDKSKWTKDGRHWYFRISYVDIDGKKRYYKSKKFIDRATAEEEERQFKAKMFNPIMVKFAIVGDEYIEKLYSYKKESTAYTYEMDYKDKIRPYFGDFYIKKINNRLMKNWREEMESRAYSLRYLNKLHGIVVNILDYAMQNYDLDYNIARQFGPFQKVNDDVVKDETKLEYITYDEFQKFISVVDDELFNCFFYALYLTGARVGELRALSWKDIDFKKNEITINKTLSTKTKNEDYKITATKNYVNRKIKMSKTLKDVLLKYKESVKKYKDFKEDWFVFGNTRFLPQTTIDRYKHKYFELSGVPEIKIHSFRHSHVSLLVNEYIKKNTTIDTAKFFLMLANRMGHSLETMQRVYMHLFPTVQDEVVDILDNL